MLDLAGVVEQNIATIRAEVGQHYLAIIPTRGHQFRVLLQGQFVQRFRVFLHLVPDTLDRIQLVFIMYIHDFVSGDADQPPLAVLVLVVVGGGSPVDQVLHQLSMFLEFLHLGPILDIDCKEFALGIAYE